MISTISEKSFGQQMIDAAEHNKRCADSDHSRGDCSTCIGSGKLGVIGESTYREERAICDAATRYWNEHATFNRDGSSSLSAELAAAPEYAACSNEMRGRVEQFELLNDPPERFSAYIGSDGRSVTVWTGLKLGTADCVSSWPVQSYIGRTMRQYHCRIAGKLYSGRGFGPGMSINLKRMKESR